MRLLRLTIFYLRFHYIKSAMLAMALTIIIALPVIFSGLVKYYETSLLERSQQTPLIVGAKNDRHELILNALYFTTNPGNPIGDIYFDEVDSLRESGKCLAIPLHIKFTARKYPLIGTEIDYFNFRNMTLNSGTLPLRLGDCVLGADIARELNLKSGDFILTDQSSIYNLSAEYPLKMRITGILNPNNSPDDRAVFADIKTTWTVQGVMHGHSDLTTEKKENEQYVLKKKDDLVVANAAVVTYTQITDENINSFHLHGDPDVLPLNSVIVIPNSTKDATILKARYKQSETRQMLVPSKVIGELISILFKIKQFFDANFAFIIIVAVMFTMIIIALSVRIRQHEMNTMFKIGCSRATILEIFMIEWTILLLSASIMATIISVVIISNAPFLSNLV